MYEIHSSFNALPLEATKKEDTQKIIEKNLK